MPDEWYYTQEGRGHGPVSEAQLQALLAAQQLRPNDIVWKEGMTQKIRVEALLIAKERRITATTPPPEQTPPAPPTTLGVPPPSPGQAAPVPPVPELDWLQDLARAQQAEASRKPAPPSAPPDWLADVEQGAPPRPIPPSPMQDAGPPPPPSAEAEINVELVPIPVRDESRRAPSPAAGPDRSPACLVLVANFALSACALAVALLALGLHFFSYLSGSGLNRYDFTTPRAALVSQMQMELRKDVRAALELQSLTGGGKLKEKLETLEVRKEVDWKGGTILFIAYQEDGVQHYGTVGFEKNAQTGFWTQVPVSLGEVRAQNPELGKQIEAWEKDGHL
jgi:hypothetical protein